MTGAEGATEEADLAVDDLTDVDVVPPASRIEVPCLNSLVNSILNTVKTPKISIKGKWKMRPQSSIYHRSTDQSKILTTFMKQNPGFFFFT